MLLHTGMHARHPRNEKTNTPDDPDKGCQHGSTKLLNYGKYWNIVIGHARPDQVHNCMSLKELARCLLLHVVSLVRFGIASKREHVFLCPHTARFGSQKDMRVFGNTPQRQWKWYAGLEDENKVLLPCLKKVDCSCAIESLSAGYACS